MHIAVCSATSPYAYAYPWTDAGFGTKISNPGSLPAGVCNDVAFSPNGDAVALAVNASPTSTPIRSHRPASGPSAATPERSRPEQGNPLRLPQMAHPWRWGIQRHRTFQPIRFRLRVSDQVFQPRHLAPATVNGIAWAPDNATVVVSCVIAFTFRPIRGRRALARNTPIRGRWRRARAWGGIFPRSAMWWLSPT